MKLLDRVRDALEPKLTQLDLWEPTLRDHVPDGSCSLYVVLLSDRDILAWEHAVLDTAFHGGKSVLDFGETKLEAKKKGVATGYCIVGVVDGQAGIWAGPYLLTEPKKVGRWDTLILETRITLGS